MLGGGTVGEGSDISEYPTTITSAPFGSSFERFDSIFMTPGQPNGRRFDNIIVGDLFVIVSKADLFDEP